MKKNKLDDLTEEETAVFKKVLPLKLYATKDPLSYKKVLTYDASCDSCKQCPGCGCMCNND